MDETEWLKLLREQVGKNGLTVRFYPACITGMRWQFGRCRAGEQFELVAWAGTPERLLEAIETRCGRLNRCARRAG